MSEEKIQSDTDSSEHEVCFLLKSEDLSPIVLAAKSAGISLNKTDKPLIKVKLAYPIKQNNYAFLGDLSFTGAPEKLDRFVNELKLNSEVIRHIITRFNKSLTPAMTSSFSSPRSVGTRNRFVSRPKKPAVEPVLTNEAIEKKIEEILK